MSLHESVNWSYIFNLTKLDVQPNFYIVKFSLKLELKLDFFVFNIRVNNGFESVVRKKLIFKFN